MTRTETKTISVGGLKIGGQSPVTVQSMCNTKTWDVEATVNQIRAMRAAGVDLVRLAVPDERSALAIDKIREAVDVARHPHPHRRERRQPGEASS